MRRLPVHARLFGVPQRLARAVAAVLVALLAWGGGAAGGATPEEELERVLEALGRRYGIAQRAVRYELEGTATVPRGRYSRAAPELLPPGTEGDVPPADYQYRVQRTLVLDFAAARMRRECREEIFHGNRMLFHPMFRVEMFDGQSVTVYKPRAENSSTEYSPPEYDPELTLGSRRVGLMISPSEEALLLAHARFPTKESAGGFERLRRPIDRRFLRFHGYGDVEGQSCVVLRSKSMDDTFEDYQEYWVAADSDGAIVRMRHLVGEAEVRRTDVAYERRGPTWVPRRLQTWSFGPDGTPKIGHDLIVVRCVLDAPVQDADFRMQPTVGMIVRDDAADVRFRYDGPDRYVDVKTLVASASSNRRNWLAWGAAGALVGVILAAVAWRRARKKRGITQ